MQFIFDFLKDLKDNNNRDWFQANKSRYEKAKTEYLQFIGKVLKEFEPFEPEIARFDAKECIFRINRDIRFSADKSPYKTNFGAYFNSKGRKSWGPGYYLHIEPGQSFVAGGMWMPEGDVLKKIRQEIDYNFDVFNKILEEASFKDTFGGLNGERLSKPPKDYKEDNPAIEFLKFKSFEVSAPLTDKQCLSNDLANMVITKYKLIKPYNNFLNNALE